jgi:hypothetical protein
VTFDQALRHIVALGKVFHSEIDHSLRTFTREAPMKLGTLSLTIAIAVLAATGSAVVFQK